jgi:cell division protein FtsI (penicillin-binding protein 3)
MLVVVGVMFALLGGRLVELQTIRPDRYVELAAAQTVRTQTLPADRGAIYDRNGAELAVSIPVNTIYTDPRVVDDPAATAAQLAPILDVDAAELEVKLSADNAFQYLARHVSDDAADEVEALDLPGVFFLEEPKRFTPSGDVGRSLVGQTDIDNKGLGGLELQFDDILTGTPGELTLEQDPAGRTIPIGQHDLVPAVKGEDIVLTLDRSLQYEAEKMMIGQVEALGAQGGTAVVSDPRTGEILAMVNIARDPETDQVAVSGNNMALTTVYEPGSVMKAITWSAGFQEGEVDPEVCVNAPDSLQIADKSFTEYKPHGGGCLLPADAIANSSNTASINVGLRLGESRLHHWFKMFGLGEPTNLGFPNEQSGVVRPLDDWWSTSLGSMSIGQGISVTPLQMLLVYNTIANGGLFVPPKLVRSTIDADGVEHLTPVTDSRPVLDPATAATMTEMLRGVVDHGTAEAAAISGYSSCGKTGTALKPFEGGYLGPDGAKHYMGTFVGFLPCENPQLSIIVVIDDPSSSAYTGGAISAPVFAELADFAVRHFEIRPSDSTAGTEGEGERDSDGRVQARPAGSPPAVEPDDPAGSTTTTTPTSPSPD